jgi:hypothetical protein
MNIFIFLLCAYGITFFLQHKAYPVLSKLPFLRSMLECTFCTAFYAGWISFVLMTYSTMSLSIVTFTDALSLGFASATTVYIMDVLVSYVEKQND